MTLTPAAAEGPEPPVIRAIGKTIGWLNATAMALSAVGVLVSLGVICWGVVMRYGFNRAPLWVDEAVGFMLVGIVMLAASEVLRKGEHIGVDLFTSALNGRARLWAQAWSSLAALAAALILVVNGWETAMFSRSLGIVTEGHLEWPVYLLMLFLPLGGLLMTLTAVEALLRLATGAPTLATATHLPGDVE
jgi:TRAP-type C4-dicarboxylate transport system permease small subunit